MTGQSLDELTGRAAEAIRLYWESVRADLSPTSMLREIEVEFPRKQRLWQQPPLGWDVGRAFIITYPPQKGADCSS